MKPERPLHIAFAPWMVAGVRTQWENMRPYVLRRPDVCPQVIEIHPYKASGLLERLPLIPSAVKGNLRTTMTSTALFHPPRLDAAWVPDIRGALPFILSMGRLQHTVIVSALDATGAQQASFGGFYATASSDSLRGRARDALDAFCLRQGTILTPWSKWAARSLVTDCGVPEHRVQVLPPGIDLARWSRLARVRTEGEPVRLLFVGGDFARKGGDLLLDVFSRRFQDRCELHLVTRNAIPERRGVHVYRDFGPNDPGLRALYARCDVFVLPTRADCFSLASLEAMATGLPVITTAVGGIPEIVAEGLSGFLIAPNDGAVLAQRLDALITSENLRTRMGLEGRRIVEDRFDAARNTAHLLDTIADLCRRRETARANPAAHQRSA